MTRLPETVGEHPAPFSDEIIEALASLIPRRILPSLVVHDPFAGDGLKLGALCDKLRYEFGGTDLEPWRGHDRRVAVGDATDPGSYPRRPHAIVTSPTYNNGVNDHFEPADDSERLTYRIRAGRPLHENNTGRYSGRAGIAQEEMYWRITFAAVACWPDVALVNVKDSTRGDVAYPLTEKWRRLLRRRGYRVTAVEVECPGWRVGSNMMARADVETILVARRRKENG